MVVNVLDFERPLALEFALEMVGAQQAGGGAYTISVEFRGVVRRDLMPLCRGAAEALARGPRPETPLTVAVMSFRGVTVVDRPLREWP